MKRAYSILTVKAIDDDQRVIEGIATTPTTDRTGDVVEPEGAVFKMPLPLLYQHDSSQPIGHVERAKVTKDGIEIRARIVKFDEPGRLKDRLDEAWQSIKSGLVRGLSIGFRSIGDPEPIKGTWGVIFRSWEWLELSAVVIPANSEASITAIKSADQQGRAASGRNALAVVRLDPPPGASGKPQSIRKDKDMATIKEQITAFEAKRQALSARQSEIQQKAIDEGRSKDATEKEDFDTVTAEIEAVDSELKDLRVMEKQAANTATPITPKSNADTRGGNNGQRKSTDILFVKSNLEPGVRFARYAQALIRGRGNPQMALAAIESDPVWMRSTPELAMVMKTAVLAGDTTTSGWASELVYAENLANEFLDFLRPMTIMGKIPGFRRVPFNVRWGGLSGGTTGYWVGQGKPIPVSKATTTSGSLAIAKAAGLVSIDKELARLSTPSAELMIRNDLAKAIVELMDDTFINPNNGGLTNEKPASMLYGVTPVTPTGTTYAAMRTDLQTLMETALDAFLDTSGSVWIMSASLALKLSMMVNALDQLVNPGLSINGGTFQGMPAIVSQKAQISGSPQFNDILVWLHPAEVAVADDGQISLETSDQVSIELDDAPTNRSAGSVVATSMVSMFQTESLAIKAVRYVNWTKRRTNAAQFIQNAAYVG